MCDYNNQKDPNAPEEGDGREKENIDKKSLDEMNEHVSFGHTPRAAQILPVVSERTWGTCLFSHSHIFFQSNLESLQFTSVMRITDFYYTLITSLQATVSGLHG